MHQHKVEINQASMAIASLENYQRFCSNYLATAIRGLQAADTLHERRGAGLGLPQR